MANGFLDKLRLANIFNPSALNQVEPLFGGLIPRREVFPEMLREPSILPQVRNITPQRGIDRLAPGMGEDQRPLNVNPPQYPDEERKLIREQLAGEMELGRGKLGLERGKFGYEQLKDFKDFGLKSEIERGKLDVDRKKQALDEWQAQNPQGEIKTDDKGRLVVISKLTGKTIDTGLKSGDLTEDEKIKRGIAGQKEVEGIRQKGRIELEGVKAKNIKPERISSLEQRRSEDDAAAELLRDEQYSWLLDKGYVTVDANGIQIKRPTGGGGMFGPSVKQITDSNTVLDQFEKDIKTKATERLNKTFEKADTVVPEVKVDDGKVDMLTPDGRPMRVPKEDVEALKSKGARVK